MSTKMTPQLRFPEFTDEWQVKKLGDFSSITTGKLDANAMVENGRYRFYTCAREFYKIDQYAFDTEALLVSGNGANVGYIHYYKGKFNAYQRTYVLDNFRENIGYIKLYLDRYLKKRILQEKFEGNMPYIVLSTLKDMPISTPPMKEQEKIADFFTAVDERIGVGEKKLELLETYKRGVMQKIFSQQIRFKDENGNEYPEWSNGILGHLINISMGQSPSSSAYNDSGDGVPLIQGNADIKNRRTKPRFWTTEVTKTCDRGDIILTVRAPSGYVALSSHQACIGRGVCAIKASGNSLIEYLYQYLLWFEPKWISVEQGSTFTAISGEDIKGLKVKIPRLEEQQKIATFLTALDDKITAEKSKLTAAQQFKKALLQRMFV